MSETNSRPPSAKPVFMFRGDHLTLGTLAEMFRLLTGRDPTEEEMAHVKASRAARIAQGHPNDVTKAKEKLDEQTEESKRQKE